MKIRQVYGLAYKLVAAAVLFTQAVFLLAPAGYVSAESGSLDTTAPSAPTNLVTTALTNNYVALNWQSSTDNLGVDYYKIYRRLSGTYTMIGQQTGNSYTDSTVTAGSSYYYKIIAFDAAGNQSGPSNELFLNVPAIAQTATSSITVIAPSMLIASANGSVVTLNWTDNSDNESGFKIYRYQSGLWTDIGNVGSNVTTKIEPSVPTGTYKYKVQAFLNSGSYPTYSAVSNETPFITVGQIATTGTATSTVATNATGTIPNYYIDFYQPPSLLSTSSKIFARANVLADRVDFTIQNYGTFAGELQSADTVNNQYNYAFRWDLTNFSNNTYQLKVFGNKGAVSFNSQYVSIQILKPATPIDLVKSTSSTENIISTSTIAKQPATINLYQPTSGTTLNGWVKLLANSYGPIRRVEILKTKDSLTSKLGDAILNAANGLWEFGWDTATAADGSYALEIFALDEQNYKITGNKINVNIINRPIKNDVSTEPATEAVASPVTAPASAASGSNEPATAQPAAETSAEKIIPEPTQSIREILQTQAPLIDPRCQAAGISDQLKCDNLLDENKSGETRQITASQPLPTECQNANIKEATECELFMLTEYVTFQCKLAGLTTKAKCREFMLSRFGRPAACVGLSDLSCQKLISQVVLGDFVDQDTIDRANRETSQLNGKYLQLIQPTTANGSSQVIIKEDTATLSKIDSEFDPQGIKTIENILPFSKNEKQLNLLILASTDDAKKSKLLISASALIDSDADGLTDDIEARLGTDKLNADSDGDGYSDGVEVRSGHNPLGQGELRTALKPMELAIVNKVRLEQPKLSGETRADILKIQKITNNQSAGSTAAGTSSELKLQGWALPDDVVSLYIYSVMPIVVTVATDENGNWTYNLDKSLVDGKHEAYVVINDEAGKVKAKSAPFSFFVKEAKAVSQNDFLGADFAVPDRTTELTGWYVSGSLLLVLVGLGGYLLYQKTRKNNVVYSK